MAVPRVLGALLDVLLPPLCVHCGEPVPAARPGVCRWCRATLRPLGAGCRRCSLPQPDSPADCGRCRDWPTGLTAVAAVRYAGAAESIAHALKYRGWTHLADLCAAAMADALGDLAAGLDVIVPVPLHAARLRERGFNQSALIAESLSARLGIPVQTALVRSRATRSQVGLGRAARRRNVEAAFAARASLRAGIGVCLIDDVATSGATLAAAAEVLVAAGAGRVTAVTFALALDGSQR
ncbi:MAG TPA: ComF family protein [Gemmatimonadota bacterium]|nr:ComF family protein [Gemmatimonadota bacterium]